MKTLAKIALAATLSAGFISTAAMADANKGKRVYQKKMKEACGMTGGDLAMKHTQKEWQQAYESGKFKELLEKECPAAKDFIESPKFEKKYKKHIFDFMYEFGKGSGNIPSC
jgi:hypothetical protein